MSNPLELLELARNIKDYIFPNIVGAISTGVLATYLKGMYNHKQSLRNQREKQFDEVGIKKTLALRFFRRANMVMDGAFNAFANSIYRPAYNYVDGLVSDSTITRVVDRLFFKNEGLISGKFAERLARARADFDVNEDAFMWHTQRAPDFLNISSTISGKFFNGRSIKDYLPMFVSEKTFAGSMKAGLIAFAFFFTVLCIAYRPQTYFGYLSNRAFNEHIDHVVETVKHNPQAVGELRKDYWSQAEFSQMSDKAGQVAEDEAAYLVSHSDGYSAHWFTRILKNGILTSFMLSLGVGLMFTRKAYKTAIKKMRIPYIEGMQEEENYQARREAIRSFKRSIATANRRATGFDANSPLFSIMKSSGNFESKGVIGAIRKGAALVQSALDLCQSTLVFGSTGEGKTRKALEPAVGSMFQIKSRNFAEEKAYQEYFDLRTSKVTSKANLDKYVPLPTPKFVAAMAGMDIKAQMWKDVRDLATKAGLHKEFRIVGAKQRNGEFSIDLLPFIITPAKLVAMLESMESQFGGKIERDIWVGTALNVIRYLYDICYLFARTIEGAEYLEKFNVKPTSFYLLFKLAIEDAGKNRTLLAHCVHAIYECAKNYPERIADILTHERIYSINYMLTEWPKVPEETRGGFIVNIQKLLAGLNSEELRPFLTGVSSNSITVAEFWQNIIAFNLNMDHYGTTGKFVLMWIKTMMFEEAIARQQRFSQKVVDISEHFFRTYPTARKVETPIEEILPDYVSDANLHILDAYLEKCEEVQIAVAEEWRLGSFKEKLLAIVATQPKAPYERTATTNPEAIIVAKEALKLDAEFRHVEARLCEQTVSISGISPTWFEAQEGDDAATRAAKRDDMALYYELVDARTRVSRERLFFVADEYQELITVDKTGGAYSDKSFHNVARSAGWQGIYATQTQNALIDRIGREAADNFMNQMRTQIFLPTEDKPTLEYIEKMSGEVDIFSNPLAGKQLEIANKKTDAINYNYLNAAISASVELNKGSLLTAEERAKYESFASSYPYTYDIFAEPDVIDVDMSNIMPRDPFSYAFSDDVDLAVFNFKDHFLNQGDIAHYQTEGSLNSGRKDNLDEIRSKLNASTNTRDENYKKFLADNTQKGAKAMTAVEYTKMGDTQAFVIMKRANMTIIDQAVVGQASDYVEDAGTN
ncbi:TraM recognition site of TraD and TraG [Caballeronia peredens]|nr:TraM recognition site of TraD and TraG [Caballeronia peredens]